MNLSDSNPYFTLKAIKWEGQTIQKEVRQWDQAKYRFHKINIGIKFTQDNQIIYSKNQAILRIIKVHDFFENPQLFNNVDQIHKLTWQGQYDKNRKKEGKWVAFWDKSILKNVGGYFNNGQKQGQWKDLFINYCDQAKVVETGLYFKSLRIGKWNYIFKDIKINGGLYNANGQKQGKWIELDERFCKYKQVTYNGEYNFYGIKVGRWDIMYKYVDKYGIDREYNGGGTYDQKGNQIKIGKWIELDEDFTFDKQVTYSGDYNDNGKKVGRWDIMFANYGVTQDQQIGGGLYDLEGNQKKIGKWIELDEGYSLGFVDSKEVKYKGEYNMNGTKIGRWDILNRDKQIGGGFYDLEGNQKKIGKWIESDKFFQAIKQVTYTGEYNINCMKVGRWDIMFTKSINQPYQQISGGGSYDQEGNQKKIGKWIEQDKFFQAIKQVIYTGEYNINGMKVGKWDIQFQRLFGDKYEQIGCGSYDQEGNQNKIGKWIDLDEKFKTGNEITYVGEYNTNGMKVCRWDILYRNQQIGGGSYDQEGNQKMIGNWIQLDKEFYHLKFITYNGEYNMDGMKIGRWDTLYCRYEEKEYKLIGGGFYDQQGNQKKIGKWLELDEWFKYERQLIYQGEYNMNGAKIGRWDIQYVLNYSMEYRQEYFSGGGSYDQEGNEKKIGKWTELDKYFDSNQSYYNGEYNTNGTKAGRWNIIYRKLDLEYIQIGGGSFDQEGTKFGKWIEITKSYEVTQNGEYNKNGVKVGTWIEMSINDNKKLREIQYDN